MRNIDHMIKTKGDIIGILKRYPHGTSQKKVVGIMGCDRSAMLRSWSELLREGIVKKVAYGTFVLSGKNVTHFSLDQTHIPSVNLHALQLVFPIIEDNSTADKWDSINQKKNWKGYVKRIEGMTIQKNTKQVQVWLWSRDIKDIESITKLSISAAFKVGIFLHKMGVTVNMDEVSVNTKHVAIEHTELEKMIPKGTKVEVGLDRIAEKVFDKDKDESAKAWIDASPFKAIETNDIKYARDVLLMPQYIQATNQAMKELSSQNAWLAENIVSHRKVLQDLTDAIRELRDKK